MEIPDDLDDFENGAIQPSDLNTNYGEPFKVQVKLEKIAGEGAYMLYVDS